MSSAAFSRRRLYGTIVSRGIESVALGRSFGRLQARRRLGLVPSSVRRVLYNGLMLHRISSSTWFQCVTLCGALKLVNGTRLGCIGWLYLRRRCPRASLCIPLLQTCTKDSTQVERLGPTGSLEFAYSGLDIITREVLFQVMIVVRHHVFSTI